MDQRNAKWDQRKTEVEWTSDDHVWICKDLNARLKIALAELQERDLAIDDSAKDYHQRLIEEAVATYLFISTYRLDLIKIAQEILVQYEDLVLYHQIRELKKENQNSMINEM